MNEWTNEIHSPMPLSFFQFDKYSCHSAKNIFTAKLTRLNLQRFKAVKTAKQKLFQKKYKE
ncbi:MAG: hypothetical protein COZ80_11995 [Ignavibacteria bacterium CG_4_8_14_3_um_filter_37_9]|nr:MAG: hypothetical protein COT22_00895 [Ignavibacteria bacterium CG08_land_8_20_14_0_20_37_9]PIW98177.1 MAG: hypothetical protein COZ80_11995 [Ignavibacteria bacterium CG_4_8_14_3_um_filter_37_9]